MWCVQGASVLVLCLALAWLFPGEYALQERAEVSLLIRCTASKHGTPKILLEFSGCWDGSLYSNSTRLDPSLCYYTRLSMWEAWASLHGPSMPSSDQPPADNLRALDRAFALELSLSLILSFLFFKTCEKRKWGILSRLAGYLAEFCYIFSVFTLVLFNTSSVKI